LSDREGEQQRTGPDGGSGAPRLDVLVVDDEPGFALTLAKRLRLRGFPCAVAHDGTSGLEQHSGRAFLCVLLDLRLPDLPGAEVLRRMKARAPATPVVVITAHGTDADEQECRAAGARDFLGKPVDIDEITAILSEVEGVEG
jgi:DNA-binding response OmpR family regulator